MQGCVRAQYKDGRKPVSEKDLLKHDGAGCTAKVLFGCEFFVKADA